MNEENLHIIPDPQKGYPEPEIPADYAWNKMAELLDTEMPVSETGPASPTKPPSPPAGGGTSISIHFWGVILGVVVIVSLLTWGILSLTNKNGTAPATSNTTNAVQESILIDSLATVNQTIPIDENSKTTPLKVIDPDSKNDLPVDKPTRKDTIQTSAVSQAAIQPIAIEPELHGQENIIKPNNDIPGQEPEIQGVIKDSSVHSNPDPLPVTISNEPDSFKSSATLVTEKKSPDNKEVDKRSDIINQSEKLEKQQKLSGKSEKLSWATGIYGNIGQVIQKDRDLNLFYGGMVTAGLYHNKLDAAIETGIGWEQCNDYGSITNNIQITDSIPGDSLNPVRYQDTTQVSAFQYRYQYLQVPLFISKQLLAKRKLSLGLKTGPVLGIMISDKKILDYTSGPEEGEIMNTIDNDYSRLKLSWQWQAMIELRWDFNDRLSLNLNPAVIFYLNNLYLKDDRPPNMPYGIGLYGGLVYRFK
jgi:hypothetical protein